MTARRMTMTVDGVTYTDTVDPRMLLVQYLREVLRKTGTVVGCDTSNCGACTIEVNGASVKSCTMLAVEADDCEVLTIEGLASNGERSEERRVGEEGKGRVGGVDVGEHGY